MAEETSSGDPYDIVLADLKAKRAQIDQAIAAIEAIKGGIQPQNQSLNAGLPSPSSTQITPGTFHAMSIVEATKQLLAIRKKPLNTAEITEAIQVGGVIFSTDNPANTVGSSLHREASRPSGAGIINIGRATWALPNWYSNPGRFQKKKPNAVSEFDAPAEDTSSDQ